jgi:hypothetical protein
MHPQDHELELASDELSSLSDNDLEAACGGLRWIDIHMPYNDFIRWKVNDPSPTRLC